MTREQIAAFNLALLAAMALPGLQGIARPVPLCLLSIAWHTGRSARQGVGGTVPPARKALRDAAPINVPNAKSVLSAAAASRRSVRARGRGPDRVTAVIPGAPGAPGPASR